MKRILIAVIGGTVFALLVINFSRIIEIFKPTEIAPSKAEAEQQDGIEAVIQEAKAKAAEKIKLQKVQDSLIFIKSPGGS